MCRSCGTRHHARLHGNFRQPGRGAAARSYRAADYDDAVRPGRRGAQATPSVLTGPKGACMAGEPRAARDRVTLADIAAAAGVSVPTVSKVLNGHADVAPKTRSRVEALLADYNYAAPRRAGRSCLIDLVFHDLSPWAVEIIRGAEEAATAEGCRIAVSVVSGEP